MTVCLYILSSSVLLNNPVGNMVWRYSQLTTANYVFLCCTHSQVSQSVRYANSKLIICCDQL